jgi:hypothetical protein
MQPNAGKAEAMEHDPEGLLRLLDLELMQKRSLWQRASARHRTSRMIWAFSIFVVVAAAFFALFFLFSQTNQEKVHSRNPAISDSTDP